MSTTRTNSGGAYYQTAVDLREMAKRARESYAQALESSPLHAGNLIMQTVGFEMAAALYCVAQAIEDHHGSS